MKSGGSSLGIKEPPPPGKDKDLKGDRQGKTTTVPDTEGRNHNRSIRQPLVATKVDYEIRREADPDRSSTSL